MFLYLSREFNFQTSLVNCDCTCGRASSSPSPPSQLVPGKLPQRFYNAFGAAPASARSRFDLRSGKSRVNFALCFANRSSRSRSCQDLLAPPARVPTFVNLSLGRRKSADGLDVCANFEFGNSFYSSLVFYFWRILIFVFFVQGSEKNFLLFCNIITIYMFFLLEIYKIGIQIFN